jgi:hypothetical protein
MESNPSLTDTKMAENENAAEQVPTTKQADSCQEKSAAKIEIPSIQVIVDKVAQRTGTQEVETTSFGHGEAEISQAVEVYKPMDPYKNSQVAYLEQHPVPSHLLLWAVIMFYCFCCGILGFCKKCSKKEISRSMILDTALLTSTSSQPDVSPTTHEDGGFKRKVCTSGETQLPPAPTETTRKVYNSNRSETRAKMAGKGKTKPKQAKKDTKGTTKKVLECALAPASELKMEIYPPKNSINELDRATVKDSPSYSAPQPVTNDIGVATIAQPASEAKPTAKAEDETTAEQIPTTEQGDSCQAESAAKMATEESPRVGISLALFFARNASSFSFARRA